MAALRETLLTGFCISQLGPIIGDSVCGRDLRRVRADVVVIDAIPPLGSVDTYTRLA